MPCGTAPPPVCGVGGAPGGRTNGVAATTGGAVGVGGGGTDGVGVAGSGVLTEDPERDVGGGDASGEAV